MNRLIALALLTIISAYMACWSFDEGVFSVAIYFIIVTAIGVICSTITAVDIMEKDLEGY